MTNFANNYAEYVKTLSTNDLKDILVHMNREKYPERYAIALDRFEKLKADGQLGKEFFEGIALLGKGAPVKAVISACAVLLLGSFILEFIIPAVAAFFYGILMASAGPVANLTEGQSSLFWMLLLYFIHVGSWVILPAAAGIVCAELAKSGVVSCVLITTVVSTVAILAVGSGADSEGIVTAIVIRCGIPFVFMVTGSAAYVRILIDETT